MSQAVPTIGMTIRIPIPTYERLLEQRRTTRVPSNAFIEQAIEEKLDRDAPAQPKRRRAS